ncbi:adenosine deaminase [Streptomyces jeddahensis]|uniref:Adenine deaminase n=1 Tax=Streptomyces jeddahensis TaxID=1716141 RepID=A0A177HEA0_9ACTN|nr:adenosine deaminase [Streptomyces jeddahensis]OAH09383.1 adenine deaminase [Streptomyces jeddahensis]
MTVPEATGVTEGVGDKAAAAVTDGATAPARDLTTAPARDLTTAPVRDLATAPVRDLRALPKAHLHLHLEGSMRPATLADLARSQGAPVPDVSAYGTFGQFGLRYQEAVSLVRDEDGLRRIVREVVEDAAADGAVWVEPAVNPMGYATLFGRSPAYVLDLMLDEALGTADRLGIGCGLLVTALRHLDPREAVDLARLAARRADAGVVAFGLAADESLYPPEPFADAFALARAGGLIAAPHAGELAGPGSVLGALDALGAQRIQHGVRAVEDPGLLARLAAEGIVLDVCPTSNTRLGIVESLTAHPLPDLLAAGVRCTIAADDSLLFGPGLLDEYETARTALALTDRQLAAVAEDSLRASGAPADTVAQALKGLRAWLD